MSTVNEKIEKEKQIGQQATNSFIREQLESRFSDCVTDFSEPYGMQTFTVIREKIIEVLTFLYQEESLQFQFLTDLTGIHYPDKECSLGVVYHLHSLTNNIRLRIKVFLSEKDPCIQSVSCIFAGANWMERETYDFYGIIFQGHPNLRRILNMDDMVAFPMRKEYPLEDPNRQDKENEYFGR